MTDARIVSKAPEGSGLTHGLLDDFYEKRRKGQPIDAIPVVGLLKVVGSGEGDTARGRNQHVRLEFVRLEPVRDSHDAEQIAWQIIRADDLRHQPAQGALPLTNSPEERKASLFEEVEEWRVDNGKTVEQLDAMFVDMLGGPGHAVAEKVASASLVHLVEFAGWITAGSKQQTAAPGPEFTDDADSGDATDTAPGKE